MERIAHGNRLLALLLGGTDPRRSHRIDIDQEMANPQHIGIGRGGLERHQTVRRARQQRGIERIQAEVHPGGIERGDLGHGRNEIVLVVEVAALHPEEPIGTRTRVSRTRTSRTSPGWVRDCQNARIVSGFVAGIGSPALFSVTIGCTSGLEPACSCRSATGFGPDALSKRQWGAPTRRLSAVD